MGKVRGRIYACSMLLQYSLGCNEKPSTIESLEDKPGENTFIQVF
jgi:hypothetical protein